MLLLESMSEDEIGKLREKIQILDQEKKRLLRKLDKLVNERPGKYKLLNLKTKEELWFDKISIRVERGPYMYAILKGRKRHFEAFTEKPPKETVKKKDICSDYVIFEQGELGQMVRAVQLLNGFVYSRDNDYSLTLVVDWQQFDYGSTLGGILCSEYRAQEKAHEKLNNANRRFY